MTNQILTKSDVAAYANELIQKGNKIFNTTVSLTSLEWWKKGTTAGFARFRTMSDGSLEYGLKFHEDLFKNAKALEETIVHEVAHLIIFNLKKQKRSADKGHGRDWRRVFSMICDGKFIPERCHELSLTPAKVTQTFTYVLNSGRVVKVKANIHKKLQQGQARMMKKPLEYFGAKHYAPNFDRTKLA